jgi:hypothetical protein
MRDVTRQHDHDLVRCDLARDDQRGARAYPPLRDAPSDDARLDQRRGSTIMTIRVARYCNGSPACVKFRFSLRVRRLAIQPSSQRGSPRKMFAFSRYALAAARSSPNRAFIAFAEAMHARPEFALMPDASRRLRGISERWRGMSVDEQLRWAAAPARAVAAPSTRTTDNNGGSNSGSSAPSASTATAPLTPPPRARKIRVRKSQAKPEFVALRQFLSAELKPARTGDVAQEGATLSAAPPVTSQVTPGAAS